MATYTREFLSGAANGLQIAVAATATPGTLIHTAHLTSKDEIYIHAVNLNTTTDRVLVIEWGGTATKDQIRVVVKKDKGVILVIPGTALTNSLVVRAFADVASEVNIQGWVNRIT